MRQVSICCGVCGKDEYAKGLCKGCYERHRIDADRSRAQALARDNYQCRACGYPQKLVLHQRPGSRTGPSKWITLCRHCQPRLRRRFKLLVSMPTLLKKLWRELHPNVPFQKELHISRRRVKPAYQLEFEKELLQLESASSYLN